MKYLAKAEDNKKHPEAPNVATTQTNKNPHNLPNRAPEIIDNINGPGIANDCILNKK